MQEGVNDLVEQLRVAVVVPPPLEAAFRLVPRSAFLVSHAVSLLHTLHISNSHTLQLKHCWHVVCSVFHHVIIWVSYTVYFALHLQAVTAICSLLCMYYFAQAERLGAAPAFDAAGKIGDLHTEALSLQVLHLA